MIPTPMTPIPAEPAHFPAILDLNARSVEVLSPLDAARLAHLHAHAAYHKVVLVEQQVAAFLLAFAPGAPYDSVNYQWFEASASNFLYVDRIVVAESARGRGLASLLYRDLFAVAAARGHACVVCEYDLDPPNPASAAFHQRFGFVEVGSQRVAGGKKAVSLQRAPV
jgi:predicted GNAT superfamily acetyltransferase